MKRRTFIQLGAVTAAFAALPHQVAQAVEAVKAKVTGLDVWPDRSNFYLVAISDKHGEDGISMIRRAFRRADKRELHEVLDRHAVHDEARNLIWFKLPAILSPVPDVGFVMAGGKQIMYMAQNVLLIQKGSWRRDVKVRGPEPYEVPKELFTTRYRTISYSPLSGDIFVD